jgi:hypothetical protein
MIQTGVLLERWKRLRDTTMAITLLQGFHAMLLLHQCSLQCVTCRQDPATILLLLPLLLLAMTTTAVQSHPRLH